MTRNEELAMAFEAAARAANPYPYQQAGMPQQMPNTPDTIMSTWPDTNRNLMADREAAIVSRVLAAIGRVYREAVTAEPHPLPPDCPRMK
jgi:hypothetical protein